MRFCSVIKLLLCASLKNMQRQLNSIVEVYSDAVTQVAYDPCSHTRAMNDEETEAFREYYENAMEPLNTAKRGSSSQELTIAWQKVRNRFDLVIEGIEHRLQTEKSIQAFTSECALEKNCAGDVVLRVDGVNYSLCDQTLTIGRIEFCDIPLSSYPGASRLHAIVRRFGDKIVVMDVGSLLGIEMRERSNLSAPCETSAPSDRRPLVVDASETAVFSLGPHVALTVNPKPCIIMASRCTGTRNFRGHCGHFICCVACADEWREEGTAGLDCPQCREPFFGTNAALAVEHVHTMQHVET